MPDLPVTPSTLPSGFCPSDYQGLLNGFSAHQFVTLPDTFQGLTVSSTTPTDTSRPWLQLDSFGRPVRIYVFASGAWLSLHPDFPGKTIIWTTTLPTMTTFDGGDANAPSAISGPMWEVVTALETRVPIGAGTLPSGTVLTVGGTGGAETVTLDDDEIPDHQHFICKADTGDFGDPPVTSNQYAYRSIQDANQPSEYVLRGQTSEADTGLTSGFGGDGAGATVAHQNLQPYLVVYFLRRTSRLFYVV